MESNDFFEQLVTHITCSQPLRDIWAKGRNMDHMFKSVENRSCFLSALMSRAPYKHLDHKYFNILMDLCVQLLNESSSSNDFNSMLRLFHASRMYAMVHLECSISIADCLRAYHGYHNVDFWLYVTRFQLAQDIARWANFTDPSRNFLNLPNEQVYVLFVINRIHSTVTSMQFLRISLDTFAEYLSKILEIFHFTDSSINITHIPSINFISWLLRIFSRLSNQMKLAHFTTSKLDVFRSECAEGNLYDEIGYSPVQELILYIAELSCAEPVSESADEVHDQFRQCICGATSGSWIGCGVGSPQDERNACPNLLCELCFRQLLSNPLQSDGQHEATGLCPIPKSLPFTMKSFLCVFSDDGKQQNINFESILRSGLLNVKAAHEYLQVSEQRVMQSARAVITRRPTILNSS